MSINVNMYDYIKFSESQLYFFQTNRQDNGAMIYIAFEFSCAPIFLFVSVHSNILPVLVVVAVDPECDKLYRKPVIPPAVSLWLTDLLATVVGTGTEAGISGSTRLNSLESSAWVLNKSTFLAVLLNNSLNDKAISRQAKCLSKHIMPFIDGQQ